MLKTPYTKKVLQMMNSMQPKIRLKKQLMLLGDKLKKRDRKLIYLIKLNQ
jgi:hypothetical protein